MNNRTKRKLSTKLEQNSFQDIIIGGGEMGERIRKFAWYDTSLGSISFWPQSLVTSVNILLQSPVPLVMLWGEDGIMLYNDAYSIFAGRRHPSLLGSKVLEGWPEVADFNKNVMEKGLAGQTLSYKDQQLTLYRNNVAEEVSMDLNYSPVIDETGKPKGVLAIVVETTSRVLAEQRQRKAEEALQRERDRLQSIFMNAPAAIAVLEGKDHVFAMANTLFQQIVNKSEKKLLGKKGKELFPELIIQGIWNILGKVFSTGKPFIGEDFPVRLRRKPGKKMDVGYFNFVAQPLKDREQKVESILVHAIEVTDQVQSKKDLREVNKTLKTIIEASPLAVYVLDNEGKIMIWNKVAEELFGWTEDEIKGQRLPIVQEDKKEEHKKLIDHLFSGKSFTKDLVRQRRDGSLVDLIVSANPVVDEDGKLQTIIAIAADITERKKLERQKDEFLGIASHELKTPVTSIKAYGQVLQRIFEKEGNVQAVEHLAKMDAQINKLTVLIADLLDVTKIQSGRLMMHEEEYEFNDLVTEIVEELQRTTERHTITHTLGKAVTMYGDKERIGQVLTNLISNAIKYSPHTSDIVVATSVKNDEVTLSVQDFGVGIPDEVKEKVFEQFFRVSGDMQHTFPGLGLGLYISSEIIKRQHGKIWVESTEGKGSTFYIKLPIVKKVYSKKSIN